MLRELSSISDIDETVGDLGDRNRIEFMDEIDFGSININNTGEVRLKAQQSHKWKGIDWDTLVIITAEKSVGLFLGFETNKVPIEWHCNLRFAYSFIGDEGEVFIQCRFSCCSILCYSLSCRSWYLSSFLYES